MQILNRKPNESGAYPAIQSTDLLSDGCVEVCCDTAIFYEYNGFVTPIMKDDVVVGFTPNVEVWKAWNASLLSSEPNLEDVRATKASELDEAAKQAIMAGCDVTLADGTTGHISLTTEDQINLSNAQATVQAGASRYPYHLDGQLCTVYSAEDIQTMAQAATQYILYHTTYCNHLLTWVRRATTVEELNHSTYGCDLPDDLQTNMEEVLHG